MRRREFISLLASTVAWPLAANGQQPAKPVIGVPQTDEGRGIRALGSAVRQGLRELDYLAGQVVIEPRVSNGSSQSPAGGSEDVPGQDPSCLRQVG
jgi:hypothetical protein